MLAPLLYMLALAGIGAAVMFSGYSQILRSNAQMTAINAVRSQLDAAGQTLSASSALDSATSTIVQPPAPYAFASVSDSNRLPGNYTNANATGSPNAVGVIDISSGVRQLDPWGKYYVYCQWYNPVSSPALPSIMVISAGPDGNLDTKCGDATAQGDDKINLMTVAEAINRANVWQVSSSSQVKYGMAANPVAVNADGSMTAASLTLTEPPAGLATLFTIKDKNGTSLFTVANNGTVSYGNSSATSGTFGTVTVTGNASVGGSLTGGATSLASLTLSTPLAVAQGGTGATTAGAARTNLGSTATGDALFTAASAGAARTTLGSTAVGDALFIAANAAAARTTLGSTAVGDALFIAADAASGRSTLGLGTMATQNANAVAITGGTITGVTFTGNITGNASGSAGTVPATGVTGCCVAISAGGTGAGDAATARSNLGTNNASNLTTGTVSVGLLPTSGVTPGTYTQVTVDQYGRVTVGANVTSSQWTNSGSNIYFNTGNVSIGTTVANTELNVYNASSATLTDFTQALTKGAINVLTNYTANNYTPGVFWSATDDNATKPKAGIWLKEAAAGTTMYLGTSNAYATGITNQALSIDYNGVVSAGAGFVGNITGNVTGNVSGQISLSDGTAASPGLYFTNDTNTGLYRPGADVLGIAAGGNDVARFTGNTSGVNYLNISASTTGNDVSIAAAGTDSNISFDLKGKGTGGVNIFSNGATGLAVSNGSSAVNYLSVIGSATGSAVTVSTAGSDTDIGLTLTPKGVGALTLTSGATTADGLRVNANSLTTGNGVDLVSTSTAGGASGASYLLNLARSGANANTAHTAYGIYSTVTNTNATSGTNIAGYFSASGATTANYGLIVANGNVGIGTTSPQTNLHVAVPQNTTTEFRLQNTTVGTSASSRISTFADTGEGDLITFSSGYTLVSGYANRTIVIANTGSTGLDLIARDANGDIRFTTGAFSTANERMRIDKNGNVGIGTTGPNHKLDVNGNIGIVASGYLNWGSTDGTSGYGIRDNAGTMEFKNSGGSWGSILSNSSTITASNFNAGSVGAPGLYVVGDSDTGFYSPAANTLSVTTGGVEIMRWNTIASGVDYFSFTPSATGTPGVITEAAAGSDTNISVAINAKGTGSITHTAQAAGAVVEIDKGAASQTGDLQQWQNSSGTVLAKVDASGNISTTGTMTATGGITATVTGHSSLDLAIANNLSDLNNAGTARTNLGLGTMATQAASAVAITGGTIDGTTIGGTTRAAGSFTTVNANSTVTGTALVPSGSTAATNGLYLPAANTPTISANSIDVMRFNTVASGVNYLTATPAATGNAPILGAGGSDTNISIKLTPKGTGNLNLTTGAYQLNGNNAVAEQDSGNTTVVGATAAATNSTATAYTTAMGAQALNALTTGTYNVAVGYQALVVDTIGTGNVGIGYQAGSGIVGGFHNVAIGPNTIAGSTSGSQNIAIGWDAVFRTTADNNIGIGTGALINDTTGANNMAIGYAAGYDITTGSQNIILGYYPTVNLGNITGSNNILIGYDLQQFARGSSNQLNIGNLIFATGLSSGAALANGNVGIGTTSPGSTSQTGATNFLDLESAAKSVMTTGSSSATGYAFSEQVNDVGHSMLVGTYGSTFGSTFFGVTRSSNSFVMALSGQSLTVGTIGAANLTLGTNNTAAITIDTSQHVGINQTSPGSALDVKGTLRLSGATSGYVGLAPAAAAGSTTYTLPTADGSSGQALITNGSGTLSWASPTAAASGAAGLVQFSNGSALSSDSTAGGQFFWDSTNHRLGIGTTSPQKMLHIEGSNAQIFLNRTANTASNYGLLSFATAGTYKFMIGMDADGGLAGTDKLGIYDNAVSATAPTMTFTGGNVGIGTTSPGTLLNVYATTSPRIRLDTGNGASYNELASSGTVKYQSGIDGSHGAAGFFMYDAANARYFFSENNTTGNLSLQESGGNVGIGTTSPAFDGNGAEFVAVNNATAHGWSELGVGGNGTATTDVAGAFAFYNSSLGVADKRIASIAAVNDGATNSGNLEFYTSNAGSNTERMRIDHSGNVGIGTTSPSRILHVTGANSNTGGVILQGGPESSTAGTALTVNAGGGTNLMQIFGNGYALFGGGGQTPTYNLQVNAINSATTYFGVNSSGAYLAGNVGIGTASPAYKLDVGPLGGSQTATAGAGGLIRNNTAADASPYTQARLVIYGGTSVDTGNWGYFGYGNDASMRIVYAKTSAGAPLLFGTTSAMDGTGAFTETMRLTTGGSLGIGASPSYKLDVSGDIRISSTNRLYLGSGPNASIYWDGSELQTPSSFYMAGGNNWVQNTLNIRGPLRNDSAAYLDIEGGTSNIAYFSGSIGIGTTGPGSKLTILGSSTYGEAFTTGTLFVSNAADSRRGVDIGYDPNYEAGFIQAGKSNVAYEPLFINPNGGNVTIGTTNAQYTLTVNGTAYASGAAGALSDIRHKKNVHDLPAGTLAIVEKLRPVTYEWKEPKDSGMKGAEMGFIAQEVEKLMPSMVLTQDDKDKTKGLKYNEFSALITKALQELKHIVDGVVVDVKKLAARVDQAFTKLAAHDDEIKKLKDENEALRAAVCKVDRSAPFCHPAKAGLLGHPAFAPAG